MTYETLWGAALGSCYCGAGGACAAGSGGVYGGSDGGVLVGAAYGDLAHVSGCAHAAGGCRL